MRKAHVFPGQGSQFPGMAKEIYETIPEAKALMERANEVLGFRITDIMFGEDADALKATQVTQPAIFIHSVVLSQCCVKEVPDAVAGHSLGEFSALTAAGALSFEDGLRLVSLRAKAMQQCCERQPGAMAAIINLPDQVIESVCSGIPGVVPANYNSKGQVVISGEESAVDEACAQLKAAGAKRALKLPVSGAFHSPLMEPAREQLAKAIADTPFQKPLCPIYQNVTALPTEDPEVIKANLLQQLTSPVKWTQTVENMLSDGITGFLEIGPGTVLQGLIRRIVQAEGTTLSSAKNNADATERVAPSVNSPSESRCSDGASALNSAEEKPIASAEDITIEGIQ